MVWVSDWNSSKMLVRYKSGLSDLELFLIWIDSQRYFAHSNHKTRYVPQPLGFVDERPLLGLIQQLPLRPQTFRYLRVVHLRVLLGHLPALPPRPHHERVHGPLDVLVVRHGLRRRHFALPARFACAVQDFMRRGEWFEEGAGLFGPGDGVTCSWINSPTVTIEINWRDGATPSFLLSGLPTTTIHSSGRVNARGMFRLRTNGKRASRRVGRRRRRFVARELIAEGIPPVGASTRRTTSKDLI